MLFRSSVFAAVSLPVNVTREGVYSNQVFIGMFRPDANAYPRWMGNLKQYSLGYVNNSLRLIDADGNSAIKTSTGFIADCARSYWTPGLHDLDQYWSFQPIGECIPPPGSDVNLYKWSNTPDGNMVEKGGAAYVRREIGRAHV